MSWIKSPASVLRDIGIAAPKDIDLSLIAYSLNVEVVYEPLHGYEANIFGSAERAVVTINADSSQARGRFSLAHELGHWTNDRGINLSIECSSNDLRQRESQKKPLNPHQAREARANVFASQLLMPTYMLEEEASDLMVNMDTVHHIASVFNTSLTSSAIRLIQVTKHPAMIVLWSSDGRRRWFDRSSALSDRIWPLQQIPETLKPIEASNDDLISDTKWLDPRSAREAPVRESVFNNTYDYILLLAW